MAKSRPDLQELQERAIELENERMKEEAERRRYKKEKEERKKKRPNYEHALSGNTPTPPAEEEEEDDEDRLNSERPKPGELLVSQPIEERPPSELGRAEGIRPLKTACDSRTIACDCKASIQVDCYPQSSAKIQSLHGPLVHEIRLSHDGPCRISTEVETQKQRGYGIPACCGSALPTAHVRACQEQESPGMEKCDREDAPEQN